MRWRRDDLSDVDDDDVPRGSGRLWGFARGILGGVVLFGGGAVVASLTTPLPDHLPGVGTVEIVRGDAVPRPVTPGRTAAGPERLARAEEDEARAPAGAAPEDPARGTADGVDGARQGLGASGTERAVEQADAEQADGARAAAEQGVTDEAGTGLAEADRAGTGQIEAKQSGTDQADTEQAGAGKTDTAESDRVAMADAPGPDADGADDPTAEAAATPQEPATPEPAIAAAPPPVLAAAPADASPTVRRASADVVALSPTSAPAPAVGPRPDAMAEADAGRPVAPPPRPGPAISALGHGPDAPAIADDPADAGQGSTGAPVAVPPETLPADPAGAGGRPAAPAEPDAPTILLADEQPPVPASASDRSLDLTTALGAGTGAGLPEEGTRLAAMARPDAPLAETATPDVPRVPAIPDNPPEAPEPKPAALPPDRAEISLPGPALRVNARLFEAPPDAPLMAVVLRDAANGRMPTEALVWMTMPLTLSIRPVDPFSRRFAEEARAAGHEVLVELPMAMDAGDAPSAALASGDPEMLSRAMAADDLVTRTALYLAALDIAIGATASEGAPLLRDRDGMRAILRPLSEHGFAWVEPRERIGSLAGQLARDSGPVWTAGDRSVSDGAGEDEIYRSLTTAAFKARRQGTVIVFLPTGPDTLKGIIRWGLERGGQEVWFAPLSAVIERRRADQSGR